MAVISDRPRNHDSASDFDFAGFQIFDRLIGAAMTELQFECFSTERLPENLMAETNPENRNAAIGPNPSRPAPRTQGGRITRAVRQKNTGGFIFQRFGRRCGCGHHLDFETLLTQAAQDVVFHSEVVGDDRNIGRRKRIADVARICGGGSLNETEA